MDPKAFKSPDRGQTIKSVDGCWAFHPSVLPRELALPQEVAPLRLEAVLSSRIEGTKTDVGQLLRYEAGERPDPAEADDAQEVRNHVIAMEHGLRRIGEGFPISIRLLREMHEILLDGVRGQYRRRGELRASPVWIGGSTLENAVFVPPPTDVMANALADLEKFLHERALPLLVQLALAHYQFEVIHPFLDAMGE